LDSAGFGLDPNELGNLFTIEVKSDDGAQDRAAESDSGAGEHAAVSSRSAKNPEAKRPTERS
jgi:hypothetical protein